MVKTRADKNMFFFYIEVCSKDFLLSSVFNLKAAICLFNVPIVLLVVVNNNNHLTKVVLVVLVKVVVWVFIVIVV